MNRGPYGIHPPRFRRRDFLALAVAGATACASPPKIAMDGDEETHPLAGLRDFAGHKIPLPPLHESVVLLDFWASWCGPCRHSFRYLDRMYRTYAGAALQVWAISLDDDAADAQRFLARTRPRFPVAWDATHQLRNRFRVSSLPTSALLDKDGRLVTRHEGFDPQSQRRLEGSLRTLLGKF